MSFQWAFERVGRWAPPDCIGQSVPNTRTGHGEGAVAQWRATRGRYGQVCRRGRAQTTSWLGVRDRNDDIMKISRRGSVHAVENQYTEFVLDALRDPQPMQVSKQWRDVFVTLRPDCETCSSVNDMVTMTSPEKQPALSHVVLDWHCRVLTW